MIENVFLLWFVQEQSNSADVQLLIGVFLSELEAEDAINQLKDKPGFNKYQEGFQIHSRKLGEISWDDGFVEE
jgi:homoserine kinase type II